MATLKKKPVVGHRKEDCASLSRENNILLRNIVNSEFGKDATSILNLRCLYSIDLFFFFFFCSTKARHPEEFAKFELKNFVNSLFEKYIKSILNFAVYVAKISDFFITKVGPGVLTNFASCSCRIFMRKASTNYSDLSLSTCKLIVVVGVFLCVCCFFK